MISYTVHKYTTDLVDSKMVECQLKTKLWTLNNDVEKLLQIFSEVIGR